MVDLSVDRVLDALLDGPLSGVLSRDDLDEAVAQLEELAPEDDMWGFDLEASKPLLKIAYAIYHYFRPQVTGIESLPNGRVLIVPNHSGQLPFDGLVVGMACVLEADPPRICRAMAERWVPTIPFINVMFSRAGVVVGDPINCRNLLEEDNAILVFPEGVRGSGKTFWNRYELQRFGRGFMRLALQTDAPIVPVSVVGAEESIISIADLKPLAKALGVPYLPVPALLPILGPLAFLPLPTKFYVDFGEPLTFEGAYDEEDEAIDEKVNVVSSTINNMIRSRLAQRESIF